MKKIVVTALSLSLILSTTGCNDTSDEKESLPIETTSAELEIKDDSILPSFTPETTAIPEEIITESKEKETKTDGEEQRRKEDEENQRIEEEDNRKAEEDKLKREQLNSFSMMYYLAITAEEIRTSKDNRLVLDDIYTSLLNDINPGAVDEITQDHLQNLRDIIKQYRKLTVKRERLQFLYNQEKAAAIRNAVPNPIAILSMTNSLDWKKLAVSTVYTVVDSYNNYKKASESADNNFLINGWELDDEEVDAVQKNRDRAFDYMVDMVQKYNLDGLLTLNEKAIEKFAEICALESPYERIRRFESEKETYSLLGNYWLELADCYFETEKYDKCLECVDKYNNLAIGIYRQDFNYVKILPKAIVAAQKTMTGDQYISTVKRFNDDIISNTPKDADHWSSRYFAAQVYLDLYAKTKDELYLRNAYEIAYDNVTILLPSQRNLNSTYLGEIKEITAEKPDTRFLTEEQKKKKEKEYKDETKRVKEYNKTLKNNRKTELPSLYEPLLVNCELLFSLADKMNISSSDQRDIEAILKTKTGGIFIIKPINDFYSFSGKTSDYAAEMKKDELIIPANLITSNSTIAIKVTEGNTTVTYDDCVVTKVERKGNTIDTFFAHITSKNMKKHKWSMASKVEVVITFSDAYSKTISLNYYVSEFSEKITGDKVVFTQR